MVQGRSPERTKAGRGHGPLPTRSEERGPPPPSDEPAAAAAAAKLLQSCPTLCDPMDCSPPGSSVHGIFQARTVEWGAIAFSSQMSHFSPIGQN